ncbi:hypothetical protein [Metabacillus arenae]|uniref:Uncharacterized protein n=1 Tax=Metabacillus arenae TaxID=2771434 RepID=A0A926NDF8_9BACI|nr:hypothetical protein [Metabacillus arenae]MBD1379211.1 hypothetical protein [Metabacillus arenae]
MTSYDEIWQSFLNNCKASDFDLPSTQEKIHETIKNAVSHFNIRKSDNIQCDDIMETVNRELPESYVLIIAHYIRLIFLINQKTYFESTWQPFSNDVGLKNFSSQLKSLESSITSEERIIERLIMFTEEDFI